MKQRNLLYASATVLIWSTNAALTKALLYELPGLQALAAGSALAFLFLLLLNAKTGALRRMRQYAPKDLAAMAGLGFLGLFLYNALYFYGLAQLTSQEACILNYLWPAMLVLFSCLVLKEKLTLRKAVALGCSFLGVVILSAGGGAGSANAAGMAACIGAAACYGLFSVLNKKAGYDQNIAMMIIWLTTAVCAAVLGLCTERWVPVGGVHWLGLLWLGVVVNAVAYLLWALALQGSENTARIANLAYLVPFLSVVVSAVFLNERVRPQALAALVFIVGGILLQGAEDKRSAG